jgi:hypothetical protein
MIHLASSPIGSMKLLIVSSGYNSRSWNSDYQDSIGGRCGHSPAIGRAHAYYSGAYAVLTIHSPSVNADGGLVTWPSSMPPRH